MTELADQLQPLVIDGVAEGELLEWLKAMVTIRRFEEACEPLAAKGSIPGGGHLALGQEAVAVGTIRALEPLDVVTSGHRPHHHALAKGITPRAVMAELFGRATGCAGGRGGSMHLSDISLGHFGSNGIVGAGLGIAMGAALAAHLQQVPRVAVGFFSDGAVNTGRTWESINLAAVWKLPLLAVCENNQYAVETPIERTMSGASIVQRAAGFGLPAMQVDGQDVVAVHGAVATARARALAGEGPTFIEALTYRYKGHNTGEVATYRTEAEIDHWRRTRDPVERLRAALIENGHLTPESYDEIVQRADAVVDDAIAFAESSPWPEPGMADAGVTGLIVTPRPNR